MNFGGGADRATDGLECEQGVYSDTGVLCWSLEGWRCHTVRWQAGGWHRASEEQELRFGWLK